MSNWPICSDCKKEAVLYCPDCMKDACEDHAEQHKHKRRLSDGTVIDI